MRTKQLLSAVALAATAAFAPAHAGVLGMGDLAITSLLLLDTGTGLPIVSGLNVTSDSRTGSAASDYNGVAGTGAGSGSITLGGGATVDVKYRCAGPDCGSIGGLYGTTENNTATHITPPASKNYALGDMVIAGSALGVSGAQGLTRANASATGPTNLGGSSAAIQNNARVTTTFTAGTTYNAAFAMGVDAYVSAFVDAASTGVTTFASGGIGFNLTVFEQLAGGGQSLVLSWIPAQINTGLFATTASESASYSFIGSVLSPTALIEAGKTYTLTINQTSLSTISEIPEPASLALAGVALLSLAGAARRRKA
jgi:hypothetical protein